jgi:hypothetical protein
MSHPSSLAPAESLAEYRGYQGLPPLVGLLTMEEAATKGLSVAQAVDRMKRLNWSLRRLHSIFTSRLTSMPIYEIKMAFSLHAHYCAEHVDAIVKRVREMRQPPYGLDESPHAALDVFFDEIFAAPGEKALLLGIYEVAIPHVVSALKGMQADVNKLFEHPTYRVVRFALIEMEEIRRYGAEAVKALVPDEERAAHQPWLTALDDILAYAGGLDGTATRSEGSPERIYSKTPYVYDPVPRRDERFVDSYNMGVNAEAMLFDQNIPPQPKTLMLFFKRMREIDVPEMMSSILAETQGKPWEYFRDMTRQLWDEARHAMMGEVGFVSLGIDWKKIPFNFTWSLQLNTRLTPLERHAVLYTIEQGLMPKTTGKQYEWEVAIASASHLSQLIQDYDWADEIVHAKVGREWLVPVLGSQQEALAYGDKVWSKALVDWVKWKEQGLTEHRNWWPEIYKAACERWGIEPDQGILAYNTTYEKLRPDMKQVSY